MNILKKLLKRLQLLSGGLSVRLERLTSPAILTYAPTGWDVEIPSGIDAGWDSAGVSSTEKEKWGAYCQAVACTLPLGFSHEHTDLGIIDNTSFHNVNITFGYVLAKAAHARSTISILDYGGGLGHFYLLGKALLPELILEYSCKEFPTMARSGKELNPDIRWYTDECCLENSYDLVMISGSLQYVHHWQQFLIDSAAAAKEYLFLTRLPVINKAASFVAIQEAYGTRMRHWQFNRHELYQAFADAGLIIVREFLAGECAHIRNAPEQCDLRGWLLRKKT